MSTVINIIGAGRLGKTLGFLLHKNHGAQIGGICNTTIESANDAVTFIGDGYAFSQIEDLPPADVTFITTPDDQISKICEALCQSRHLKKGSIILHCSGTLTSDVLSSAKNKGCHVASVHPMKSFANPQLSILQYEGTFCAIEGDIDILPIVTLMFTRIGSIPYPIHKNKKPVYHAAGVFASNYLVTLSHLAQGCLQDAGIEQEMAMKIITDIMQNTVSNLQNTLSAQESLTGPIKRGDISTVKRHIDALENAELKQLYAQLGMATIPLSSLEKNAQKTLAHALNTMSEHAISE